MAIVTSNAGNKAACDALLAVLNTGSTDAAGDFELLNNTTSIATIAFNATAFGAATLATPSVATATFPAASGTPAVTNIAINKGRFRDRNNAAVISFDISASGGGGDMIVTDPNVPSNATAISCSGVTFSLNITN